MNGALVEDGTCINVATFESIDVMSELGYVLIPDGYGIGSLFDGTTWTNVEVPVDPVIPEPEGPSIDPITLLQAQVQAQSDRTDFVEDCIAEMAAIIYA